MEDNHERYIAGEYPDLKKGRCAMCQHCDAAISDLKQEVERLRELVKDMDREAMTIGAMIADTKHGDRIKTAERKLARLVDGLEAYLKRCAIFRQEPTARDLRELINTATGERK